MSLYQYSPCWLLVSAISSQGSVILIGVVPPPPVAFKVVQEKLKFVPSVISSIAPVLAVLLHSSLAVDIVIPLVVTAPAFTIFTHSIATTQADTLESVVSLAFHNSIFPVVVTVFTVILGVPVNPPDVPVVF